MGFGSLFVVETKFASALGHEQVAGLSPSGVFGRQQVPIITESLPGPGNQPQTITLPPPHSTVGVMFFF